MKLKHSLIIVLASLLFVPLILSITILNKSIVAAVGSHSITLSEFANRYNDYLVSTGVNDNIQIRKSILNNIIKEILLYNYDNNKTIFNDPVYKKQLEWTRKQVILAYLKDQEVYADIKVSEEELRDEFIKTNERIAARHLYARTKEEADNFYQLLQLGFDFETLAKQTFTDTLLQNNGGYLGFFSWGDMDPAFEETLSKLRIGEISLPVETSYGYSIIKLEDKVRKPIITETEFLNNKSKLERELKINKKKPAEEEYINRFFDRTKLTFNEKALENILHNISKDELKEIEFDFKKPYLPECVTYDGKVYNQIEIEKKIKELPQYHLVKLFSVEKIKAAIEGFIIQDKLMKIALEKGYDKEPKVNETFGKMSMNLFLKYKTKEILDNASINDSLVFKYYQDNLDLYSSENELNVQEIIVESKNLAETIKGDLINGRDFGKLAKKYSLRNWSAENNGVMGVAPLSKFGNLQELLWKAGVGEILGPKKIEDYYGIFIVLEKIESRPKDFNTVKSVVAHDAKQAVQLKILNEYINKLSKNTDIEIDEEVLGLDI